MIRESLAGLLDFRPTANALDHTRKLDKEYRCYGAIFGFDLEYPKPIKACVLSSQNCLLTAVSGTG
jgi:hypothetical protein